MGSAEITNYMVNGDLTPLTSQTRDSVSRLHDIVHRLEEENDYLRPLKQNDRIPTEYSSTNGFSPHDKEEEEEKEMCVDSYSLENVPPINDAEFDEVDYEKDDSWLYSPKKPNFPATPVKNADDWLRDKAMTPELLRIRGSLSEKLEVIAIENRKGLLCSSSFNYYLIPFNPFNLQMYLLTELFKSKNFIVFCYHY